MTHEKKPPKSETKSAKEKKGEKVREKKDKDGPPTKVSDVYTDYSIYEYIIDSQFYV